MLEKQVNYFFIVYHLTASFPASPIYYGFSGEYYIKSKNLLKKFTILCVRLLAAAFAASLAAFRRSSLYGAVRRKEKRPFSMSNSMQPVSAVRG